MKRASPLAAILLFVAGIALAVLITACPMNEFKAITIGGIDLSAAKDGTYAGLYEKTLVKATVLVTIKAEKITDIRITRHDCGKGKPAEAITKSVVDKQTTRVDTISGATGSSLILLKAIENAVAKATN